MQHSVYTTCHSSDTAKALDQHQHKCSPYVEYSSYLLCLLLFLACTRTTEGIYCHYEVTQLKAVGIREDYRKQQWARE